MTHPPPDHVCDGVPLVDVEADPFPEDQVHGSRVGQTDHGLNDQVGAVLVWKTKLKPLYFRVCLTAARLPFRCDTAVRNTEIQAYFFNHFMATQVRDLLSLA